VPPDQRHGAADFIDHGESFGAHRKALKKKARLSSAPSQIGIKECQ
jgi:hypothetical protein